MQNTKTPLRLWDMCATYIAELRCLTAQPLYSLHGRMPFKLLTGNTPDISEYIAYEWYQPVWYHDSTSFPNTSKQIGRWIGVAHNIGQAMCSWILPASGVPIARSTVQPISKAELTTPIIAQQLETLDNTIATKLGNQSLSDDSLSFEIGSFELRQALQDADDDGYYIPAEPEADKPEIDSFDEDTYSRFMSTEVLLPRGDYQYIAKVLGRKRDGDGNPIGQYHPNPILDTTVHEVEFPDGTIQEYAANVLADALYSQVDPDGNRWLLLEEIIDHEKDNTAPTRDQQRAIGQRFTTKGCSL